MSFSGKPELTTLDPISNDGFWVDVTLAELMKNYRIPAEYDNGVIQQGLITAMLSVNDRLLPVKTMMLLTAGSLSDYLQANQNYLIAGEDWAVHQYKHAVYCKAKAFLLQNFNSLNRRKDAENEAKEAPETEQWWENQAQQAVFNLLNRYASESALSANHDTFVALI